MGETQIEDLPCLFLPPVSSTLFVSVSAHHLPQDPHSNKTGTKPEEKGGTYKRERTEGNATQWGNRSGRIETETDTREKTNLCRRRTSRYQNGKMETRKKNDTRQKTQKNSQSVRLCAS